MKVKVFKKEKEPEKVFISTEFIKLDAFLKFSGALATGGEAKIFIQEGQVQVNGETCLMRGKKLRSGDKVLFHGKEYLVVEEKVCM